MIASGPLPDRTLQQWRQSEERLERLAPEQRPAAEHVIARVLMELRRRLGSAFTVQELVWLYEDSAGWTFDLATQVAPGAPWAWEPRVIDTAFLRYVNSATDYAGGRRLDHR